MIKNRKIVLNYILIVSITLLCGLETFATGKKIPCQDDGKCFICNPTMRDKGRLWCREHDRYEDRCWMCHPELEDKKRQ